MEEVKKTSFDFWRETLKSAQYVLAPMVDQSELPWRLLARRHGAQLCYTPMYHAAVFVRDIHYRKEAMQSCEEDRPLIVQFCANNPETLLKAAQFAEPHCEAVDLNLGCPQSVARRGHYGAFLQDEWDLLYKMVSLCAKELKVPITCKIRVFDDIGKTVRYAKMLERAGCQLLTVHGRTVEQKGVNTGLANWDHITAVRKNVKIPVFANGNIQTLSDIHRCLEETAVQGIMSAEGHLYNPVLFTGRCLPVWELAHEYLDLVDQYPCSMSFVRGHLFKLFHHAMQVNKELRDVLGSCKSFQEAREFTECIKQRCQADVAKYETDKASLKSDLPLPYWICQPYTRPSPGEPVESKSEKEATLKRTLQNVFNGEAPALSKNKLKKLRRYPNKNFDAKPHKFIICRCLKPRGTKCLFDLCKACCRQEVKLQKKDCPGHKFVFRNKGATEEKTRTVDERISSETETDVFDETGRTACMETTKTSTEACVIDILSNATGESTPAEVETKDGEVSQDSAAARRLLEHRTPNSGGTEDSSAHSTMEPVSTEG